MDQEAREFTGEAVNNVDAEMQQEVAEEPPRMLRDRPVGPTRLEREEHERTHMLYKIWCKCCVMGRAREDKHTRKDRDEGEEQVPMVTVDCCFIAWRWMQRRLSAGRW